MNPFGPHNGGRRGAPNSAPTQLGAPRGNTPQGGVHRSATPQGGVHRSPTPQGGVHHNHDRAPDSARTYVHGHPRIGSNPPPAPAPAARPQYAPSHHAQTYVHQMPPAHAQQQYSSPPAMPRAVPQAYAQPLPPLPPPPPMPVQLHPHVPPQPAHQPPPPSAKKREAHDKREDTAKRKRPAVAQLGDPQLGFRFKLTFGDGHIENMLVDAERALIGSAAHCEVRLPPEIAAHEHVEVYAHEGAVHFATKPIARDNLPSLDGVAAMEGTWGTGSTLRIGDVSMTIELVSLGMQKAKPPVWALFVAIPAIALTAVGIALARPVDRGLPPVPEAPVLIGPKEGKCPDLAPEQKTALANEKLRVALAKRERSPFAPQEGYEAVLLFEGAAACFRATGDGEQAKDADDAADLLRVKLEEDYRVRRVRLEHAYRTHQVHAAKRELVVLVPMTAHRKGPYTEWLAAVDRAATLEIQDQGRLQP
jgi:hypothetical protein